jgi:hypothetical protein
MHVDTLRGLQQELAEAQNDLTDAQRRVDTLTPLVRAYEAYIKTTGGKVPAPPPPPSAGKLPSSYPDAIRLILKSSREPMSVNDLLDRFAASGRPVKTSYPYRTVYKVLRTHEELIENVGGGRWKAKETNELLS